MTLKRGAYYQNIGGVLNMGDKKKTPCPPSGIKCIIAMGCTVSEPTRGCLYRKKKGKCCVTDGVKY